MIQKINYQNIDWEKYNACLQQSVQRNFYAQKEILDFLCKQWEILVFGDYEAIMPIPIVKKWGIRIVHMPLFCQQLGVFSRKENSSLNDDFYYFLNKNYAVHYYAFNADNCFSTELQKRNNYQISLVDYSFLRKKYFKGRKSTVKSAQHLQMKQVELNDETQKFIGENFKGLDKETDQNLFQNYLILLQEKKLLQLFGSFLGAELTNLAITIFTPNQISLLGLINKTEFRKENGASFLIDRLLQKHISEKSFNFMGGSIRGQEVFFKSFGAKNLEYPIIKNTYLKVITKFFIR